MSDQTAERVYFDYDGGTFGFARVVFVNLLLQVLTLGIFRFWARTRERRFLWSHVRLGDDRLEYTGTGMELFVGFLIAMVVLVPIGGIFQGLGFAAGGSPAGLIAVSILQMIVIIFLVYVATYRARRYRLTRTLWRGIRGTLTGSAVRYAGIAMAYLPLVLITAGLGAPFMRIGLMRREIDNMRFGSRSFSFDGRAQDLFAYWLVPWLMLLGLIGGYVWIMYLNFEVMDAVGIDPIDPEAGEPDFETMDTDRVNEAGDQFPMALALLGGAAVLYMITVGWYRVREFRYLAGRIAFEGIRFSSELRLGRVVWIYISYLMTAAAVGMGLLVALVLAALVANGVALDPETMGFGMSEIMAELDEDSRFLVIFGTVLILALVLQTLSRVMVFHRLARAVVNTLALNGAADFSRITQALDSAPRTGEGLADAFDLGDF